MKKWIALVLFCCLMFAAAGAEDYSSVPTEELMRQNEQIMQELIRRQAEENGRLPVADEFGVKIYFDGFEDTEKGIRFLVLNQADEALPLEICAGALYVNNRDVLEDGYILTLDPGMSGTGMPLTGQAEDAGADDSAAVKIDVKFLFSIEKEGLGKETIHETDLITFYADGNAGESGETDNSQAELSGPESGEPEADEPDADEPDTAETNTAEPDTNEQPEAAESGATESGTAEPVSNAAAPATGSVLECDGELVGGSIFEGPRETTVRLEIRNVGSEAFPDSVILYYPDLTPVEEFGTPALEPGASQSWEGTWTVTQKELDDGEIPFYVRYPVKDPETGEITYKARKLKFRITVIRDEEEPEEQEEEKDAFPLNGTTTVAVNMRSGPSKNNGIIRKLKKGQSCVVLEIVTNEKNEEWAKVEISGKTGYVMTEYLSIEGR